MALHCQKCQAEYDLSDAFCRKCGQPLAQEASFSELPPDPALANQPEVKVVEVTSIAPTEATTLVPAGKKPIAALSKKVGAKLSEALKSEQGKKLARGATVLAVAVGVELVTQVAGKLNKNAPEKKAVRPPVSVGDALLKAMEEQLDTPEVDEIYMRERIYIRRTS